MASVPAEHLNQDDVLQFFTDEEAAIIDAIAGRLIPGDADDPGAREARAVIYIDRAIAGYFAGLQVFYREGIVALDTLARAHGDAFVSLSAEQQDDVLKVAENAANEKGSERLAQFFAVVREHVIEGTFGDPAYGGNRDAIGWRMIGFPGAQWGYTPEQMRTGFDVRAIPIATLATVQTTRRHGPKG
jgi:gluconate 2-dehydrogenase gamma chain